MDNVLPLPTRIDRLIKLIHGDIARQASGDREWIEGSYDLCLHLVELREQFPGNVEFGRACEAHGLGNDVIDYQTRAAAIAMGHAPEALRACLEATERRSLRMIHKEEFGRFDNRVKTAKRPRAPRAAIGGPKERHALEVYDRLVAQGRTFTRPELAAEAGVSPGTAARAYTRRQLEEEARGKIVPLDPATVPASTRERMEAWQRAERKRLRLEIDAELRVQYDFSNEQWLKHLHGFLDEAKRIKEAYSGIMSKRDYQTIVKCLHPDTTADQMLKAEAFRLFTQHKGVLLKPEPAEILAPPLPSLGELLARRRTKA